MGDAVSNRRLHARYAGAQLRRVSARIRPGHAVAVQNLSERGALVTGSRPIGPNTSVDVQISVGASALRTTALVVRSRVVAIDREFGVTYETALSFDAPCGFACEVCPPDGYPMPEDRGYLGPASVTELPGAVADGIPVTAGCEE
jgi:hypothetical protein